MRSDSKPSRKPQEDEARPSRLQQLQADDKQPPLPDLIAGQHLDRHFFDVGPAGPGPSGPAPITYAEIRAWQQACAVPLSPWEAQTLRAMSVAYVGQMAAAEAPDAPAPFIRRRHHEGSPP